MTGASRQATVAALPRVDAPPFVYAPHALRLTGSQWLVAGAVLMLLLFVAPWLWWQRDPWGTVAPDYRLPYEFSNDYWLGAQWCRKAVRERQCLVIGDSVVWGEYVRPGDTLSGCLNRVSPGVAFANLGVNGLHPAALLGWWRYYGGTCHDRSVILVLNVLWLSSPRHDLRLIPEPGAETEVSINHPALVPQFRPRIACYTAGFDARVAALLEPRVPLLAWVNHLNTKSRYETTVREAARTATAPASGEPLIDDSSPQPFRAMLEPVPGPEDRPHSQPLTWEARGIPLTHVAWPRADESLQWRCSRDLVRLLQARGNRVWVLISPFNPHLLTPASRELHGRLLQDVCAWLQSAGVPFSRGTPPPSTEYADASHPLAAGYERLAREMLGDPEFDAWLQAASTPAR